MTGRLFFYQVEVNYEEVGKGNPTTDFRGILNFLWRVLNYNGS